MVLLRTSEGIWEHAPRKNSLKIMSVEVHLENKLFFYNILKILIFFQYIDIVSKRLLGAFSGMRPDDFNLNLINIVLANSKIFIIMSIKQINNNINPHGKP